MQDHIQNYTDQGIYTFTFEGLTAEINDKGKVVKKQHGFPNWKSINKNNFTEYLYYHHRGLAVMTGKISNITGFDFDNKDEYDKMIELHPELKNNYTVQTNKGFHIYFRYNDTIKTTTNAMNSFTVAIGPSFSWSASPSPHNESLYPFLNNNNNVIYTNYLHTIPYRLIFFFFEFF
jgi:hypothetical protein